MPQQSAALDFREVAKKCGEVARRRLRVGRGGEDSEGEGHGEDDGRRHAFRHLAPLAQQRQRGPFGGGPAAFRSSLQQIKTCLTLRFCSLRSKEGFS